MGRGGGRRRGGRTPGKSPPGPRPGGGPDRAAARDLTDPAEVDALLRQQGQRTVSRRDLGRRHDRLEEVSPEPGVLDVAALAGVMGEDLQEGVSLLLDLSRATDPALRAEARRVAATLVVPAARRAAEDSPGGGAARFGPVGGDGLDLDLDATLEALAERPRVTADDLRWRGWRRPGRAVVLLVDASGSVAGRPLETAVVTAAALVGRAGAGDQLAVVAFWSRAVVLRHLLDPAPAAQAVERLLALRGGDTTDLRRGLTAALAQAALARTSRRDVVVLTDGMANEGSDPLAVAASAAGTGSAVHVLGLSDAPEAVAACIALADAGGGRFRPLPTPAQAATAVDDLLR